MASAVGGQRSSGILGGTPEAVNEGMNDAGCWRRATSSPQMILSVMLSSVSRASRR